MIYRAVLHDPGNPGDRPQQVMSNHRQEIDAWAAKALAKAVSAQSVVMVYETAERQIDVIRKPEPEKKPDAPQA